MSGLWIVGRNIFFMSGPWVLGRNIFWLKIFSKTNKSLWSPSHVTYGWLKCHIIWFWGGGGRLCCISVSSPPFSTIKGSFTTYHSVFWRAQRDERCVCPCSRYISHYLVLGGFCCISVSSPPFFIVEGLFTMYSDVVWRGQRGERFMCLHSWAIPHYLVLVGYAVSPSVLHHFLSLKAHFQCIQVSFERTEEMSGVCCSILKIFHIIWFWGGYAVSQ